MYAAKADELADGRWIWTTSGGWNLDQLDNPTVFTFDELSAAAPKNPLWIQGSGIAGSRVNQAALDLLGLAAGSPGVVLGPDGKPTGQLAAPATALANAAILAQIDAIGIDGEAKCLKDFIAEANSRGLTAWKDAGGNTAPWGTTGAINDGLHVEEGAMHLYRTSGLNARIAYNAMSGYAGYPRQLEDTRNADRLPRRRHVPVHGPRRGHDAERSRLPDVHALRGRQAAERRDARRGARPAARRLRGRERRCTRSPS